MKSERTKRRFFFGTIALYYLLSGIDYALILPTIRSYLHEVGAPSSYVGVVISCFSAAGLFAAPAFGKATDYLQKSRYPALIGAIFSVLGHVLYFTARNKEWIAIARFVAGIGFSLDGTFMGTIGRSVAPESKSKIFAIMLLIRQTGMVVGPAGVLLLNKVHFMMGPIIIDKYSSAGFILAICWIVYFFFVLICYDDIDEYEVEELELEDQNIRSILRLENGDVNADGEKYTLKEVDNNVGFFKESVIIGVFTIFCSFSAQTGMETTITIVSKWYLGWELVENAILFITSGLGAVVSYLIITIIVSKKIFSDRQILLYGVVMANICCICIALMASYVNFRDPWFLPCLIIQIFFFVGSLPPMVASGATIISKNTNKRDQAFTQSIRTVAERSAQILFPNWYSSFIWTATNNHNGFPMVAGSIFLLTLDLILVTLSWKYLRVENIKLMKEDEISKKDQDLIH